MQQHIQSFTPCSHAVCSDPPRRHSLRPTHECAPFSNTEIIGLPPCELRECTRSCLPTRPYELAAPSRLDVPQDARTPASKGAPRMMAVDDGPVYMIPRQRRRSRSWLMSAERFPRSHCASCWSSLRRGDRQPADSQKPCSQRRPGSRHPNLIGSRTLMRWCTSPQ